MDIQVDHHAAYISYMQHGVVCVAIWNIITGQQLTLLAETGLLHHVPPGM